MVWTNAARRVFPALVAALLLVSCSGSDDPAEVPEGVTEGTVPVAPATGVATPTPTASPTAAAVECPNEEQVTGDRTYQVGISITADVDGDGAQDEVWLARNAGGEEGCQTFVVVELATVAVASAPAWEIGAEGGLPQPRLHGFANIDGNPGAEILVDEAAGAATQFVGAFVLVNGDLSRVTFRGSPPSADVPGASDLFPYGGSVGHVEAVDCTESGIVVSTATPDAGGANAYEVVRHFYTFEGATLDPKDVQRETVEIQQLNRFPEYSASPFGSCAR